MAYPPNYRYTKEHEWIVLDGKIGTIGITDYAQNSLGDIVYVDAPKVGDTVTANQTFGSVESVKAVTEPDKINAAAHDAWIIRVELSDPSEWDKLLDAAAYEKFIAEEQ
jgi:glycine cleavage system H protein